MIYRSTFKGAEDENHVIKTYKRRWTSENDMRKKMINWYKVWCLQKMINCEKKIRVLSNQQLPNEEK